MSSRRGKVIVAGWLLARADAAEDCDANAASVRRRVGGLMNRLTKATKKAKRRFFVLSSNSLDYYKDNTMECNKGSYPVSQIAEVSSVKVASETPFTFDVATKNVVLRLSASSETELIRWFEAINSIVRKNQNRASNRIGEFSFGIKPQDDDGNIALMKVSGNVTDTWLSTQRSILKHNSDSRQSLREIKSILCGILIPGGIFRKYTQTNWKLRKVFCDSNFQNLFWCSKDGSDLSSIILSDVIAIRLGCSSLNFPPHSSLGLQRRCFTIATKDVILDLQVHEDSEMRDDWVHMFRHAVLFCHLDHVLKSVDDVDEDLLDFSTEEKRTLQQSHFKPPKLGPKTDSVPPKLGPKPSLSLIDFTTRIDGSNISNGNVGINNTEFGMNFQTNDSFRDSSNYGKDVSSALRPMVPRRASLDDSNNPYPNENPFRAPLDHKALFLEASRETTPNPFVLPHLKGKPPPPPSRVNNSRNSSRSSNVNSTSSNVNSTSRRSNVNSTSSSSKKVGSGSSSSNTVNNRKSNNSNIGAYDTLTKALQQQIGLREYGMSSGNKSSGKTGERLMTRPPSLIPQNIDPFPDSTSSSEGEHRVFEIDPFADFS